MFAAHSVIPSNLPVRDAVLALLAQGPLTLRDLQRKLVPYSELMVEAAVKSVVRDSTVQITVRAPAPQPLSVDLAASARTVVAEALARSARASAPALRPRRASGPRPNTLNGQITASLSALRPGEHFELPTAEENPRRIANAISCAATRYHRAYGGEFSVRTLKDAVRCTRLA